MHTVDSVTVFEPSKYSLSLIRVSSVSKNRCSSSDSSISLAIQKMINIFHNNGNSFDMIISVRIIRPKVHKLVLIQAVLPQILAKDKKHNMLRSNCPHFTVIKQNSMLLQNMKIIWNALRVFITFTSHKNVYDGYCVIAVLS